MARNFLLLLSLDLSSHQATSVRTNLSHDMGRNFLLLLSLDLSSHQATSVRTNFMPWHGSKFYSLLFINFKLRIYCFIADDVAMADVSAEYEVERLKKAKEEVKKSEDCCWYAFLIRKTEEKRQRHSRSKRHRLSTLRSSNFIFWATSPKTAWRTTIKSERNIPTNISTIFDWENV